MNDPQAFDYFEGMTSISAVIKSIKNGDSDRQIFKVLYDKERAKQKFRELRFLENSAKELGFQLVPVDIAEIDDLTSGS